MLFLANDTPQTNGETVCSVNRGSDTTACGEACFEGIRIFDLSDPANPVLIKGVYTDCGSHTHTLVPDLGERPRAAVHLLVPGQHGPRCQNPHAKISIVSVPLDAPETASVIAQPVVTHPLLRASASGCHDITVYPRVQHRSRVVPERGPVLGHQRSGQSGDAERRRTSTTRR